MGKKIEGPAEPDAVTAPVQMASLAASIRPTGTPLSNTPPPEVRLVDLPASSAAQAPSDVMLAMAEHRGGGSLLRPSPKNAMLAYMMVSAPFDV